MAGKFDPYYVLVYADNIESAEEELKSRYTFPVDIVNMTLEI